jgi:ABC-type transport system involved in cytochrome c biogenesis permease subunit
MYCSNCSLLFELEVGFWYGAMYVSYAIGVAIMLFLWGLSSFLFPEINIFNQIFFVIFFILLSAPVNYHYSRLIWINIFVHYKNEFL